MIQTDFEFQERIHKLAKRIYDAEGSLPVLDKRTQGAQWNAWAQWRKEHSQPVKWMKRQDRFTVLTEWSPADFDDLERRYAGGKKTRL